MKQNTTWETGAQAGVQSPPGPAFSRYGFFAVSMRAAVRAHEAAYWTKGVRLIEDISNEQTCVLANPHEVAQVVWTLLSNALKATPIYGTVRIRLLCPTAFSLRVEVVDSGAGLTPEAKALIFEDMGGEERRGLILARLIIRARGGDMGLESGGLGKGCSFWFTVPYPWSAL